MGGINQIGKEVVTFHFCLRWVHHVISKDFGVTGCQNFKAINGYNMITKKHMVFYYCRLFRL